MFDSQKRLTLFAFAWLALGTLAGVAPASAQCIVPVVTLSGPPSFAACVAIDGDHMLLGDSSEGSFFALNGAVHAYDRVGGEWVHTQTFYAPTPLGDAQFGTSVALHGEWAVVGAPRDSTFAPLGGLAFVYRRVGGDWVFEQTLIASDAGDTDSFGMAVAISGDLLVVGATTARNADGAAYVFRLLAGFWLEEAILTGSTAVLVDTFGDSLAIHDGRIIVGAPGTSFGGAAFAFNRVPSGWQQLQEVLPVNPIGNDGAFGRSVAVEGSTLVVGAPIDGDTGSATVFEWTGSQYAYAEKLWPVSTGFVESRFGSAVSVRDGWLLVGAWTAQPPGDFQGGAAVAYQWSGSWVEAGVLTLPPADSFHFGYAVLLGAAGTGYITNAGSPLGLYGVDLNVDACPEQFRRGDANLDFQNDIGDAIHVLGHLFQGTASFPVFCAEAADANDDGFIDIGDAIFEVAYLFQSGAPPPAPGDACGSDPTPDSLGCVTYPFCP